VKVDKTRWVALMIQLEQQQHGEFVCGGWWGGWVADTNYLYPARWGWINIFKLEDKCSQCLNQHLFLIFQ